MTNQKGISSVLIIIIVVAVIALAVVGYMSMNKSTTTSSYVTQTPTSSNTTDVTTGYSNSFKKVSLDDQSLSGWKKTDYPNDAVLIVSYNNGTADINMTAQSLSKVYSLSDLNKITLDALSKTAGYKVVSEKDTTLGGLPAHEVIYTANGQNGQTAELEQVWAVTQDGNRSYGFTYSNYQSDFSKFEDLANTVMASVKVW